MNGNFLKNQEHAAFHPPQRIRERIKVPGNDNNLNCDHSYRMHFDDTQLAKNSEILELEDKMRRIVEWSTETQ